MTYHDQMMKPNSHWLMTRQPLWRASDERIRRAGSSVECRRIRMVSLERTRAEMTERRVGISRTIKFIARIVKPSTNVERAWQQKRRMKTFTARGDHLVERHLEPRRLRETGWSGTRDDKQGFPGRDGIGQAYRSARPSFSIAFFGWPKQTANVCPQTLWTVRVRFYVMPAEFEKAPSGLLFSSYPSFKL